MLVAGRRAGIPVLIGGAGGSGSRRHLAWTREIVEEIAREEGLRFRMALIDSEQDPQFLHSRLAEGRIRALRGVADLTADLIDRSSPIVGMIGPEPFQAALDRGAEVVLAGRSTDASIFAAIPLREGVAAGPSWHAAKTIESGAAPVEERIHPDCILATIGDDGFTVTPLNPAMRCTPASVAAHTLYENRNPYRIPEPGGIIDTRDARYTAVDDRSVRVTGSAFEPSSQYTIKLEGAELVGYQSIVIAAVRDPVILRRLDSWLATFQERVHARCAQIYGGEPQGGYSFHVRVYGGDPTAAMRPDDGWQPREVCLVFDMTAATQEIASTLALSARHIAIHNPVPEWTGLMCTVALPYSPHVIDRGAVHRYTLNHVVEVDDPLEMCTLELVEV
jgi:hypothetical protein